MGDLTPIKSADKASKEAHRTVINLTTVIGKNIGHLDELIKRRNGSGARVRFKRKSKLIE